MDENIGESEGIDAGLRYGLNIYGGDGNDKIDMFPGAGSLGWRNTQLVTNGGNGDDKLLGAEGVGGAIV